LRCRSARDESVRQPERAAVQPVRAAAPVSAAAAVPAAGGGFSCPLRCCSPPDAARAVRHAGTVRRQRLRLLAAGGSLPGAAASALNFSSLCHSPTWLRRRPTTPRRIPAWDSTRSSPWLRRLSEARGRFPVCVFLTRRSAAADAAADAAAAVRAVRPAAPVLQPVDGPRSVFRVSLFSFPVCVFS
jgi:hypothetical protein